MRQSWTDERLDDFRGEVAHRFDAFDRRFEQVDRRFDKLEARFDRMDTRLDGLHRVVAQGSLVLSGSMLAGFAALVGVMITQL